MTPLAPAGPLTAAQLLAELRRQFPDSTEPFHVEFASDGAVQLSLRAEPQHLRPGDVVSGPTLMMLADTAVYLAILAERGLQTQALTTHLAIDFLRPCPPPQVLATTHLLFSSKRRVVAEVHLRSAPDAPLAAKATVTYACVPQAPALQ